MARVDAMVQTLERLRVASIRATYGSDWIIHTSSDREGRVTREVGYLQDIGAERAGKLWGIEVGQPLIEREDFPDQTYCYHMLAEAWSKVTGERLEYVEGSRWSGDTFFTRQSRGPDEKIDPTDVRKAAYANLHGRAVRALAGLNAVPVEMLRQAGLDLNRAVSVAHVTKPVEAPRHGAEVAESELVIGFGSAKGKRPADLADADLAWYGARYEEQVADPAKAKFQKANERILAAIRAEEVRRHGGLVAPSTPTPPSPSSGPSRPVGA
jgi:hypothetical protein